MTEHKPINPEAFERLVKESGSLSGQDRERVENHLMYGSPHSIVFSVRYRLENIAPAVEHQYQEAFRSHCAAVLSGATTALTLWPGELD